MSIVEILLLLVVALIVIPPDRLPEVMQMVGKILRELRLASNTIMRELSGAIDDPRYLSERPQDNPMTTPWSKDGAGNAPAQESREEASPQQ
ncbi:MAG TPA: twin-arginine translocase TatA/TatE family subunit [Candidatus Binataceae bacterium]|nr:twin-arginine translocase TatA/TatE family subunit [Candidatus Binataceae bacterium]